VGMEYLLDRKGERRLAAYFHRIGEVLRTAPQRASFATYALGLMGDGERKSMEPMAARACPNPEGVNAAHERLTYSLGARNGPTVTCAARPRATRWRR